MKRLASLIEFIPQLCKSCPERFRVKVDGFVDSGDTLLVRSHSGGFLP